MSEREQYARQAEEWTERAYADARAYLAHRADLVVSLGPRLEPGDEVLDLACGDGGLGDALIERGLRYHGVDSTPEMAAEARRRLGDRAPVDVGDLNEYAPPAPVAATTVFRAKPGESVAERVPVRFGKASVNQIVVLEGLEPGDIVALADTTQWSGKDRLVID